MHRPRSLMLFLLAGLAAQGCGGGKGASGPPTYTLSGVVTANGAGHAGATVDLAGPASRSTVTDPAGKYSFAQLPAGDYTVTPSLAGQAFTTGSTTVTVSTADVTGVDFALVVHALAGTVTLNGRGLAGVQVSLSGDATASTTSGAAGDFSFAGLLNGSYAVAASLGGQTFSPGQRTVPVAGADATAVDFAMDTYALSGRVTLNGSGYGLGGTVQLGGDATLSADLDASGGYAFSGLPSGSYTVTPSVTGQSLSPSSLAPILAGAPSNGNDFALVTYAISGRVLDRGAGVPSVPLALTGAATAQTATDASGSYSFDGLLNGAYTVATADASRAFAPASLAAAVSDAPVTGVDFQAAVAATPVFGSLPGTYTGPLSVAISCPTPAAVIRYTTDGTAPSDSTGTIYTGPVPVTASTVIRAVASASGWITSPESAALFTVSPLAVAAGAGHSIALRADGTVWGWGGNAYGQVGDGTATNRFTRVWVPGLWGATAVAAGDYQSAALVGGTVWTWGYNYWGQLGDGTTTTRRSPAQVPGLTGVVALSAGSRYDAALRDDGTVWTWGNNIAGQLGDGTTTDRWSPVQVPGLTSIVAVAAGSEHTLALASDGTVWAWGANAYGQLGDGTTTQRLLPVRVAGLAGTVVAVSAGGSHSMALASDGTVWTWGGGSSGELGDGLMYSQRSTPGQVAGLPRAIAVAAGNMDSLVLGSDGSVWSWGWNLNGQLGDGTTTARATPAQVSGLSGAVAIAGSGFETLVVTADRSLWAIGLNVYGTLGDATTTNRTTPVRVWGMTGAVELASGEHHTVVAKADGSVWGWGRGDSGQLGDGNTLNRTAPVRAAGLSGAVAVAAGRFHTVALRGDGTVWTWGANNYSQLGDGTVTPRSAPVQVPGLSNVVAIAAGGAHTLARRADGTVWAWGYNFYGQLGDGTSGTGTDRSTPVQVSALTGACVAIAGGYYHSLAVKSDGTVWAWGFNANGQLGDGTSGLGNYRSSPVQNGAPSGMIGVAADGSTSLGLRSDGTVWGWGANWFGGLGDGTANDRWSPVPASELTGVLALGVGYYHAVALATDRTVKTWGNNASGQLGDGTATDRWTAAAVPGLAEILAVSAGFEHTSALTGLGTVWSWGYNLYGQLGDGTTTARWSPVAVTLP